MSYIEEVHNLYKTTTMALKDESNERVFEKIYCGPGKKIDIGI